MPVQVINFPFQGQDDKCLVLSNSQWAATGIGTSWKRLWIGIRHCVEDFGASLSTNTGFFVGVMSNPEVDSNGKLKNGFLSKTPGHMAGLYHSSTTTTYYSLTLNRISYYIPHKAIKRAGQTSVTSSESAYFMIYGSVPLGEKRYALIVELLKSQLGSTYNLTAKAVIGRWTTDPNSIPVGTLTLEHLQNAMQASDIGSAMTSVLNQYEGTNGYTNTAGCTVPVNESTDGPLNAIHIAWGMYSPRLAISEILYVIKE
jgi:hypothetical protein